MHVLARPWSSTLSGAILLPTIVGLLVVSIPVLCRILIKILHAARDNGTAIVNVKTEFDARMQSIEKELRTNSGSSLKDAVIRIDERTVGLDDKLDRHLADAGAQVDRLNRHIDGAQCRPAPGGIQ